MRGASLGLAGRLRRLDRHLALVGDDLAVAHDDHPVRIGADVRLVGHQDHGDALLAIELADDLHDLVRGAGVEVAGRLVGQQHGRAVDQRPRQGDALLLSAGELAGRVALALGQADAGELRAAAVVALLGRSATAAAP